MISEDLQALKIKREVENAQNETENAWKIFSEVQMSYRSNALQIFEKMAFYAVGSISLSITYVGYIISQEINVLKEIIFFLPLYAYLFISWGFLVLNLLTTIFVRWSDITYVFWAKQKEYHQAKKESEEKKIPFFETYPNVVFSPDKDKNTEKAICEENIKILNTILIPTTAKYEKRSFLIDKILRHIAIVAFIIGILLLLFFAIWTVYLRVI